MTTEKTAGWGLYPVIDALVEHSRNPDELGRTVAAAPLLAQGRCRSYGDACLGPRVVSTLGLDNLLDFDATNGILRAEAGASLDKIIRFILPRGYFLPVTPGTKYPTLGGCIAADVHGKNHHTEGSIGNFVEELEMVLADGRWLRCSRHSHADLFWATLGGMGLTGLVYAVTLRLKKVSSAYLAVRTIKTRDFAETCRVFAETAQDQVYSVAWIDCLARGKKLGRSLVMLGDHIEAPSKGEPFRLHSSAQKPVPFFFPDFALNRWSMQAFNSLYYHRQWRRQTDARAHYEPFFYPLDAIANWNRVYGRRGFLQYQFVVPFAGGQELLHSILARVAARGTASFLAVLKTLGPQSQGLLSFPMPGFTLALDLPLSDSGLIDFLHGLNDEVATAGGRVYLAKDAMMSAADFSRMYPGLPQFKRVKAHYDPQALFRSHQSDRLGITC
jgi:decaprenylphospho-beta-D-ribofuranose 2-oxidase